MANIYTSKEDENLINRIINKGLKSPNTSKWKVLRIALAKSLQIKTEPDEALDKVPINGRKEYRLETVTGKGKSDVNNMPQDWDIAIKALLSIYYQRDLLFDEISYYKLLQRHIRRGLREINLSWKSNSDFHAWLSQEFFSGLQPVEKITTEYHNKLLEAFSKTGIQIAIRDEINGPRLTRYKIFFEKNNQLNQFKKGGLEKITNLLNLERQDINQVNSDKAKYIYLDIPRIRDSWRINTGQDLRQWIQKQTLNDYSLSIFLGTDIIGNPYSFKLADINHFFISGRVENDKNICLHTFIISLLEQTKNNDNFLKLVLIDSQSNEFSVYKDLPNLYSKKIFNHDKDIINLLKQILDEVDNRNKIFTNIGVSNIDAALEKGKKLSHIIIFIEELADLIIGRKDIENYIIQLAQKAKSIGIHLILSTKQPDSQIFNALLHSSISSRIAFSVKKSIESKIIIDEIGAEKLLGEGDMLIKLASDRIPTRVHGVLVNRDDSAKAVKQFLKGYKSE